MLGGKRGVSGESVSVQQQLRRRHKHAGVRGAYKSRCFKAFMVFFVNNVYVSSC